MKKKFLRDVLYEQRKLILKSYFFAITKIRGMSEADERVQNILKLYSGTNSANEKTLVET